jgi:4-amino-4-deoxychorismate lyase
MKELTDGAITTWVNGAASQFISAADRGLLYGDGVFETMHVRDGAARFLPLHLQRLAASCDRLAIEPLNLVQLTEEIHAATRQLGNGIAKLVVTRGTSTRRGYAAHGAAQPTRILSITDAVPRLAPTARVEFSSVTVSENPLLAGMKHLNRLENVLAQSSMTANTDEVLMCSADGAVVCGSMSNVFVVRPQRLLTPRIDRAGVAGIVRRVVMREAAALGWAMEETTLTRAQLLAADEVFLTNARIGVWPVGQLAGRALATGALTARLAAIVEAHHGSG